MARSVIPYQTFNIRPSTPFPSGQVLYKPMTTATLTAPNGESLRFMVLLDTGADSCVFPLTVAIALKIDVLSLPSNLTSGVGSASNVTYYGNLTIDLGNDIAITS